MIRWVILAVLVVVVTAAATVTMQLLPADVTTPTVPVAEVEPTGPPPAMDVEGDLTHDFGKMSQEAEGTHPWKIRNTGEGPLELQFVESPCTCTHVRFDANGEEGVELTKGSDYTIEPGDEATLFLSWETRNFNEYSTYARFATNDPEQPSLTFTIEGTAYPAIILIPESIELPLVLSDEETSGSALIYSPDRPGLKILGAPQSARPELITAEAIPLTDKQVEEMGAKGMVAGYELRVTVHPGMPLGNFVEPLTVRTDHPMAPKVEIRVSGRVVGPISAMPSVVYMPPIVSSKGGGRTVTLTVRNHPETAFEIFVPESLASVLKVKIEPVDPAAAESNARQYRLTVEVLKGASTGKYRGSIVLKTDHPQAEEVKVPVEVIISKG